MSTRTLCFLIALLGGIAVATAPTLSAQPDPIRWGDVPDDHFALTTYAADTAATAVVLCDYGQAEVDAEGIVVFKRHLRVKLLKEAAYDTWGTVRIYRFESQRARDIRAQTLTRDATGRVMRTELDRRSIFRDRLDDYERITFTFPALSPGAILEYTYTLESENPVYLPDWYFQHREPTLHSEYRAKIRARFNYTTVKTNYHPFTVEESRPLSGAEGDGIIARYVKQNVPALRDEPYLTRREDFLDRIDFQLSAYYHYGIGEVSFLSTWPKLAQELRENVRFGRALGGRAVGRQAAALTEGLADPWEQLNAVYNFVRTNVATKPAPSIFMQQDMDDVLRTKSGTTTEANLLMLDLLRQSGFDAQPALLSTRDNGTLFMGYPLLSQLNYVAVRVAIDGGVLWLDASDPLRPLGMMPARTLTTAWLPESATHPTTELVTSNAQTNTSYRVTATLAPDGTLSGRTVARVTGYHALDKRRILGENALETFVTDELVTHLPGVLVTSPTLENAVDLTAPLMVTMDLAVPTYAQQADDLVLVNPVLFNRHDTNPFTTPRRGFPVDFNYPQSWAYDLTLTLPEGYVVDEKPEDVLLFLAGRGIGYRRTVTVEGSVVHVHTETTIARVEFAPSFYPQIRTLYERMVNADREVLVLRRAAPAETSTD